MVDNFENVSGSGLAANDTAGRDLGGDV